MSRYVYWTSLLSVGVTLFAAPTALCWFAGTLAGAAGLGYTVDGLGAAAQGCAVVLFVGWAATLVRS